MNNNRGFSLVELAIGLAVITILILAVSVASGIRDNARIQSAANSIQTLRSAAENFVTNGNLNYANLTVAALQTANLLPAGFDASASNPWGGSFSVGPNASDNTRFDIALSSLHQTQAAKLSGYFQNSAGASNYDATQTTWTVTF